MPVSVSAPLKRTLRLGVNVDHVATVRQARGTSYPDPVAAALLALASGADSITVHLREDRRHIQERDVVRLLAQCPAPVNLEMAIAVEMIEFACKSRPRYVCLVPERREELTTEGGLDVSGQADRVSKACAQLARAGIETALFVDPDLRQLAALRASGAPHLEIHTGRYCDLTTETERAVELEKISEFAIAAAADGFEVHAGHGLNVDNVAAIAEIPQIVELNIGHSIIARALFIGLPAAVAEMRRAMTAERRA
jgi:pyridoxine 5-phosphate synthase